MAPRTDYERIRIYKEEISDIERCFAGDTTSRHGHELKVKIENLKGAIYAAEQRLGPDFKPPVDPPREPYWAYEK